MKQIAFCNKDETLINKIEIYKKENGLPSFIEAVRQLCSDALERSVNVKIKLK